MNEKFIDDIERLLKLRTAAEIEGCLAEMADAASDDSLSIRSLIKFLHQFRQPLPNNFLRCAFNHFFNDFIFL